MKLTQSQLETICLILVDVLLGKNHDHNTPLPTLPKPNAGQKPFSVRRAKSAINEVLTFCDPLSRTERTAIDFRLKALCLPNLETLEAISSKRHVGILKRKLLRNDVELKFVEDFLDNQLADISESEIQILEKLTCEYVRKKQSG